MEEADMRKRERREKGGRNEGRGKEEENMPGRAR